ncbi:hypothetical protein BU14_0077s0021 [Porphyra umbilicalis]|uniref:Uncharacterized protein n=1 Tax=Porphyra umbilicalis TaxID=2786 RepID=A0A1X6PEY3_PORUM|nr:hypothetical protein BU14_0077s0021 [Porphyra umbilicalis]|eukprot:OSX79401.1 hypothetical protein BU14_0077s0021 [Porphyra umbilicalis]
MEDVSGGDAPPRRRNAVAVKEDAWRRPGAAGGALAGALADPSGSSHTRGHGSPRLCPHQKVQTQDLLLPAPPVARLVQGLGAARAARGAAGADGRPWGVSPATNAPGDPWKPPATTRGITRSHPRGGRLPPHDGERTTRPWRCRIPSGGHPSGVPPTRRGGLRGAPAAVGQPPRHRTADGTAAAGRRRAPPPPLPTASHSAAEVAAASMAAVAVVTLVPTRGF